MSSSSTDDPSQLRLGRWFAGFIAVGIFLRLALLLIALPIWGDQAALGLSIVDRSYSQLLGPLDNQQVAPIGFLWSQRAIYQLLGMSEIVMHLLPALAGIAALALFAFWARSLTTLPAATIAVGCLAVTSILIRESAELKPYSCDLLATLLLISPATRYILRKQYRWLICLILAAPVALVMSFPAIFTAGGVGLALAVVALAALRRGSWGPAVLVAIFAFVVTGAFRLLLWPVAAAQYQQTSAFMRAYWSDSFPPANPAKFLLWFLQIHSGSMFAYPFEASDPPWCAPVFVLFVVGLLSWFFEKRWALLGLLLAPFGLTLIAAAMRRYPYGGAARIAQHLAPAIVLFIGIGTAKIIDRMSATPRWRIAATQFVFVTLLIVGAIGLMTELFFPSGARQAQIDTRQFVRSRWSGSAADPAVVALVPDAALPLEMRWYLRERNAGIVFRPDGDLPPGGIAGPVWIIGLNPPAGFAQSLAKRLGRESTDHWTRPHSIRSKTTDEPVWEALRF
jgi:hypothetical protein